MTAEQTEVAGKVTIHEPGVYTDLTDLDYHSDPVPGGSLSRSGMKRLLPPSTPAHFKWERDHPPETKPVFEFGKAAHRLVLGVGPEIVKLPYDDLRTAAAKAFKAEAEERGAVVLKEPEWVAVHGMAEALRAHPVAAALFDPERGHPEQSLFWPDEPTGVTLRARLDWLPDTTPGGRLIIPDYKTATSADPREFARKAPDYGYDLQDPMYTDGARALGLGDDIAFVFIVQQKTPPYLVSGVQLHDDDRWVARQRIRRATDLFHQCTTTNHWPGYDDVTVVEMPVWYRIQNGA
jgi:hypothetical protein